MSKAEMTDFIRAVGRRTTVSGEVESEVLKKLTELGIADQCTVKIRSWNFIDDVKMNEVTILNKEDESIILFREDC
ncbi:MAG: hypothetical protein V1838_02045 [Patescibacteria group bacterium]